MVRIFMNQTLELQNAPLCSLLVSRFWGGGFKFVLSYLCNRPNDLAMRLCNGFSAWNCHLVRLHFDYNSSKAEVIRKRSVPWPCGISRVNIFVNLLQIPTTNFALCIILLQCHSFMDFKYA